MNSPSFLSTQPFPKELSRPVMFMSAETGPFSTEEGNNDSGDKFATKTVETIENSEESFAEKLEKNSKKTRVLGSQELLMLPRQYSLSDSTFPPMSHVSTAILSSTPSLITLKKAIANAIQCHPLLRASIKGDGEPTKRIDLFKMVREGEPNPETFVNYLEEAFIPSDDLNVLMQLVDDQNMLQTSFVNDAAELESSWKESFRYLLDHGPFANNLLWSVRLHRFDGDENNALESQECALSLVFNHAISDQSSAHLLFDHLLTFIENESSIGSNEAPPVKIVEDIPPSLEESILGPENVFKEARFDGGIASPQVVSYVAGKAAEGFRSPVILPDDFKSSESDNSIMNAITTITGRAAGGDTTETGNLPLNTIKSDVNNSVTPAPEAGGRYSTTEFRTLSAEDTNQLLKACRGKGVTISNALTAAAAVTASKFIEGADKMNDNIEENASGKKRNYKVLQSLDMRRFHDKDTCATPSCHAGSMDLMLGPIPDKSDSKPFWDLSVESNKQTKEFFDSNGPENAVRVFDFAMQIADMNNLVHLTAVSEASQGRAYSAGVTNAGVYEKQKGVEREGIAKRENLKSREERYKIKNLYFATSHARSGCLYQVSCLTINDEMQFTFHPAAPVVSPEVNRAFADSFINILREATSTASKEKQTDLLKSVATPVIALASIVGSFALHGSAWMDFIQNIMAMKENASPEDFSAALNFWIFFAVGHPILQPILWISDVLHGSPGPILGGLIPLPFLIGNIVFLGAMTVSKEFRTAVNIFAISSFFAYIGAGLDGKAGLGDFNLAVNDNYEEKIVKGCPAYDLVKQPSMNDFDLQKYQGKWYEHKFHDWTQFKEVYDTTLDIKLTEDGKGWIDDFAVKGPSPNAAKLSWDKSPVANGAHYFLFGRVDESDPAGVLRESGFGVEFPNYIVDVKKDAETGEYKEAIQFQCLERGGVRVFEGINFMSRSPTMTEEELIAMHARAEKAGMYPYGASPEQMHLVERRPVDAAPIDNNWQVMWRAIGVDKLLELLTESIEDGGR